MATGNLFLGTARKKIGDVVMYRRNGKQMSRVRVSPSNPRSYNQCMQRMIFASLTISGQALAGIVDHSWEGVRAGQTSRNHFVAVNSRMARGRAFNPPVEEQPSGFLIKGAKGVAPLPLLVSSGSLVFPSYEVAYDSGGKITYPTSLDPSVQITDAASYEAALRAIGLQPGEQLSIVAVFAEAQEGMVTEAYSFESAWNMRTWCEPSRIVFKRTSEVDFTTPFSLIDNAQFNSLVIDDDRSENWLNVVSVAVSAGALTLSTPELSNALMCAAALVRSSYNQSAGSWRYSNATLLWADDVNPPGYCPASLVWPSYGDQATEPDSERYLQQADNLRTRGYDTPSPEPTPEEHPGLQLTSDPAAPVESPSEDETNVTLSSHGMAFGEESPNYVDIYIDGVKAEKTLGSTVDYYVGSERIAYLSRPLAPDDGLVLTLLPSQGGYTFTEARYLVE